jgi:hypothetical protein
VRPNQARPDLGPESIVKVLRWCADYPGQKIGALRTSPRRIKVEGGVEHKVHVSLADPEAAFNWKQVTGFPKFIEDCYPGLLVSDVVLTRVHTADKQWTLEFDTVLRESNDG